MDSLNSGYRCGQTWTVGILSALGRQAVTKLRSCKRRLCCCLFIIKKTGNFYIEVLVQAHFWLQVFRPHRAVVCCLQQCPAASPICNSMVQWGLHLCLHRSRGQEAAEHRPEEHWDRSGCGDEELDDTSGQPGVNGWEHEQLQLWGKVSSSCSCGYWRFSMKLVVRQKCVEHKS